MAHTSTHVTTLKLYKQVLITEENITEHPVVVSIITSEVFLSQKMYSWLWSELVLSQVNGSVTATGAGLLSHCHRACRKTDTQPQVLLQTHLQSFKGFFVLYDHHMGISSNTTLKKEKSLAEKRGQVWLRRGKWGLKAGRMLLYARRARLYGRGMCFTGSAHTTIK